MLRLWNDIPPERRYHEVHLIVLTPVIGYPMQPIRCVCVEFACSPLAIVSYHPTGNVEYAKPKWTLRTAVATRRTKIDCGRTDEGFPLKQWGSSTEFCLKFPINAGQIHRTDSSLSSLICRFHFRAKKLLCERRVRSLCGLLGGMRAEMWWCSGVSWEFTSLRRKEGRERRGQKWQVVGGEGVKMWQGGRTKRKWKWWRWEGRVMNLYVPRGDVI